MFQTKWSLCCAILTASAPHEEQSCARQNVLITTVLVTRSVMSDVAGSRTWVDDKHPFWCENYPLRCARHAVKVVQNTLYREPYTCKSTIHNACGFVFYFLVHCIHPANV